MAEDTKLLSTNIPKEKERPIATNSQVEKSLLEEDRQEKQEKRSEETSSVLKDQEKFDALGIAIASPEEILSWSYGEVLKPETMNYRTLKPERDGLFCERIFGPVRDFECYCGKYKKVRYRGIICDKCGVEVTRSLVRRERMGHINLAVPVAHTWYVRGVPSVLATVLDIPVNDLERVIYFAAFIILSVNEELRKQLLSDLEKEYKELKSKKLDNLNVKPEEIEATYRETKQELLSLAPLKTLSENQYYNISLKYGNLVKVGIGAEAILELLKRINVDKTIKELEEELKKTSGQNKKRLFKRLKILRSFKENNILPEYLILTKLPVLPPDLRPMVQLDGGRFAASDLNDLYRRVINRNNRLKRLLNQGAPEVIVRNEKRMLQEAVDALIDNEARHGRQPAATVSGKRKLRSLSDMLRGKQGRFRQNLLGKRVDYSGRSVIVVGPKLKIDECGLPKIMALELFKPFIIGRLISEGYVHNVKNAGRMIERQEPVVWDILESIVSNHYVLLNRAPTLHRLGIQAFKPVLIEGKAIQIHPLVCEAFNADFDGDQMAVHVPLSEQAKYEAEHIMASVNNFLKPASGEPTVSPRQDMVLGLYYLTEIVEGKKGEGKVFASPYEALMAYENSLIDIAAKIKVKMGDELIETSVGRIIFNSYLPSDYPFVNELVEKKKIRKIISDIFQRYGKEIVAGVLDALKDLGFRYATLSGATFSMEDLMTPPDKEEILKEAEAELAVIDRQYNRGLIAEEERYQRIIELWMQTTAKIQKSMLAHYNKQSPIYKMILSGARGSVGQLAQMAGMKGLMVDPAGNIIELPIRSNFKEGLNVFEYFISTHGSRKGRTDTALRTSESGYLTRRLIDVAQDIIVTIEDCGSQEGLTIDASESEIVSEKFAQRLSGRILNEDVLSYKKGTYITDEIAEEIEKAGIEKVNVRSVIYCKAPFGVCQKCYGKDLATGKMVELGTVVGIMAAQAIGEPGTQLTMKTFHMGGVAGVDITTGLPRVEELFECRTPKNPAVLAEISGLVTIDHKEGVNILTITAPDYEKEEHKITKESKLAVKAGEKVRPKDILFSEGERVVRASLEGIVEIQNDMLIVKSLHKKMRRYEVPENVELKVSSGEMVEVGDQLTEGHWDLASALKIVGKSRLASYIIREIKSIYASQAQNISDKHLEIILRQIFSKGRVLNPGDSEYLVGDIVSLKEVERVNKELAKNNKKKVTVEPMVMGITKVALKTDSFLSAASFQETINVLIETAVEAKIDRLRGLKENVIIGRLIPAGTGFRPERYTKEESC